MASYNNHNPNDQPGLEVVPEPEAPQVVEQPHWDKPTDTPYGAAPPSGLPGQGQGQQHQYYQNQNGQPPYHSPSTAAGEPATEKSADKRILGLPRKKFLLIFGALVALLIVALAVGLGVGLGTKNNSNSSDSASAAPSTSAAPIPIVCPDASQTVYTTSGGSRFNITCGIDYGTQEGARDLGSVVTATMEDCINTCAANTACVGAGWGDVGTGSTSCYTKSRIGSSHTATSGWLFAAKQ